MKMWISKYALSEGVKEVDGEIYEERYVKVNEYYSLFELGRDVHETRDEALKAAEEMRIKKLRSLDKLGKKISALVF